MWRVFKDNWKLIITGLIIIPIVADLIIFCPAPFPFLVVESTKEWLNFFAAYISALMGAFVSFAILYKTIEHNKAESLANRQENHTENEINRNLQISILKYQINKDKNNTIKELFAKYIYSLDYFGIKSLAKTFDNNKQAFFYSLRQLMESTSIAYQTLEFNLYDFKDVEERQFIDRIDTFRISYNELLMDLLWMLQPYYHEGTDEENRDFYIEQLKDHEAKASDSNKGTNRIWHIAQQYDYRIKNNSHKIINECIDKFNFRAIKKIANDFFDYERAKNEALINISE